MKKTKPKKSPKSTKAQRKPKPQPKDKAKPTVADPECPFRPETLYARLWTESDRGGFQNKAALIAKVAEMTKKPIRSVEFAFQVLKAKNHRSNGGRSSLLEENGKVKFIALKKPTAG